MTPKAVWPVIAAVAALGLAGCAAHGNAPAGGSHAMARDSIRLTASRPHGQGLSAYDRRFMAHVPAGATGYPSFGLVLAPPSASSRPSPATTAEVVSLFRRLPVAQAMLGSRLATAPQVTFRRVTDYLNQVPGVTPGVAFPAVVITYHGITCQAFGPPGFDGPHQRTCTTMAVYDLASGQWLGIDQFTVG